MKTLALIALLLAIIGIVICNAQESVITYDDRAFDGFITRMDTDSIFLEMDGFTMRIDRSQVRNITGPDKFKKYLLTQETFNPEIDRVEYVNYKLYQYRRQLIIGGVISLTGGFINIMSAIAKSEEDRKIILTIGTATSFVGSIVSLTSLRWFNRFTITGEYYPELGYRFKF